jgi:glycosyltransferase involved in cell wall biosynthesis
MPDTRRKRLLYASPFPPMATGISDYSEVLIYGLKKHFEITLLINDYRLSNERLYKDFEVKVYKKSPRILNSFDFRIYNIGNHPQFHSYIYQAAIDKPGLIILHDFVLYYLTVGYYRNKGALYSKIYELAGARGLHLIKEFTRRGEDLLECKDLAPKLPLNRELINSNNKIMVHSDYAYQRISGVINDNARLKKINMVDHVELFQNDNLSIDKKMLFKKYDIPGDHFVLGSFGHINQTKLNHIVCQTVNTLCDEFNNKLIYLMVGEGDYINEYLSANIRKTGYVDLIEFNSFIEHTDIVVNLRHPSMGETSAAIIRALGLGKPCIVSNDAWFSELSDDVVVKVENDNIAEELHQNLLHLLENPHLMKDLSDKAKEYVQKEHGLKKISREIAGFLRREI